MNKNHFFNGRKIFGEQYMLLPPPPLFCYHLFFPFKAIGLHTLHYYITTVI